MDDALADRVWDAVSDRVGDDLRAVTHYERTEFDTRMRDDVRARYTADEDQSIVDATVVDHLRVTDVSDLFETGRLHALVRVFEEAWVVSWPDPKQPKEGFIVSIQRGGGTATAADVEWCVDYLSEEFAETGA